MLLIKEGGNKKIKRLKQAESKKKINLSQMAEHKGHSASYGADVHGILHLLLLFILISEQAATIAIHSNFEISA